MAPNLPIELERMICSHVVRMLVMISNPLSYLRIVGQHTLPPITVEKFIKGYCFNDRSSKFSFESDVEVAFGIAG